MDTLPLLLLLIQRSFLILINRAFFYAMFPLLIINIRKNWPLKLLFSVSLLGLSFLIISITRPPAVITGESLHQPLGCISGLLQGFWSLSSAC